MMAGGDGEKGVEAADEAFGILLPELVLKEDAHGVHADGFGEAQLAVVDGGVEGRSLKHLELVDGIGGNVVRADEPGLAAIPGVRRFLGPAGGGGDGLGIKGGRGENRQGREKLRGYASAS